MPMYPYNCDKCNHYVEIRASIHDAPKGMTCNHCGEAMTRIYSFHSGNKEYSKPIVSQSLAITPEQAAEHRMNFPDIKLQDDQFPVFENYQQHDKYLEKTGFVKKTALHSKSKNGKIIKRVTMGDVRRRLEEEQGSTE